MARAEYNPKKDSSTAQPRSHDWRQSQRDQAKEDFYTPLQKNREEKGTPSQPTPSIPAINSTKNTSHILFGPDQKDRK